MQIDKIFIASDHAGFGLKKELKNSLSNIGYEIIDLGADDATTSVDYPDFSHKMAKNLDDNCYGILICGTGIGISIAANRHANIRCALCHDEFTARLARQHNDANVIAMGARTIGTGVALDMIKVFLNTEFEGGRHERRVKKIEPQKENS
ncbi:ribose 5-phosphate isomerase B [Campylobacter sp. RM13119]|uniref:ribose 5-phosphate isomerase B n=1 Tax=Campylobacter TaxID=194 RepID=UPI0014748620|nr:MULTISPECIES: ribose 5-phosphate isomerase B [unclassified Campylobacter]MBE3021570.1 ribose 5-phosphate isomerase B [Campylobacter sp. 7477a]MBE3605786.1 ribose 5-phosphate isomerase B [Campylobacter sp. RM13119]MBE3609901.1 ribose 5-phosphate isomerase B [Campylobacter sp. RM12916]